MQSTNPSSKQGRQARPEGKITKKRVFKNSLQKKRKQILTVLTPEQQAARERLKKVLAWLCETFPQCFDVSAPKPLKRHIHEDLFLQLPKDGYISKRSIRRALAFYTKRKDYSRSLLENPQRFNLEGVAVEAVETPHKQTHSL